MTFIGLCLSSPLLLLALFVMSAFTTAPAWKPTGSLLNNFGSLCTLGMMVMVSVVGIALLANVVIKLLTWKR